MEFNNIVPDQAQLVKEINELKQKLNAVILVHNYQLDEIQQIGDFLGDSLGLSKQAANTENKIIVFCGVKFMAETAKILSPDKTVLLPVKTAGCPMADMVDIEDLRQLKRENPDAVVVTYVNSSTETKALSDYCCTSANARKIIESIPDDKEIIFLPDQHLGAYVTSNRQGRSILWKGFCPVHQRMKLEEIKQLKRDNPQAKFIIHPEAPASITKLADAIESTGGMVKYIKNLPENSSVIVGTELGMINRLRRERSDINFIPASSDLICYNMKSTRLVDVRDALKHKQYQIEVDPDIAAKARKAIKRMISIG
ncbi:MAG: quinolinate synthase NadA [Deltaproteobacteria bacterium]|jgi:quinolinate synthase|nr:quinolinate synthase NadA [Deltaproteobacteria bacterium]